MTAESVSFRPKWRNGASGTSDMDGDAARVAVRESGDERINLLLSLSSSSLRSQIARDVSVRAGLAFSLDITRAGAPEKVDVDLVL